MEEEDLTVEELLKRCVERLHGLNEDGLTFRVTTGQKVVILDGEDFYWVKNALLSLLDHFNESESE